MTTRLGIDPCEVLGPRDAAAESRAALRRTLVCDAELRVAALDGDAIMLGAFQRASELDRTSVGTAPVYRRGSGGPAVRVGTGTIHVLLALAHPGVLTPCDPPRVLNRYVRPLLRALTKVGAAAHYFGRDWVSVEHRPAAWIGFAHDATTRRTAIEAFVAVTTPFALGPRRAFLGKTPGTLESLTGRTFDVARVRKTIVDAYVGAYDVTLETVGRPPLANEPDEDVWGELPWTATTDEEIGVVGVGRDRAGRLRVGGELLASEDAVRALEARAAELGPDATKDDFAPLLQDTLGAPGVALLGIRSFAGICGALERAR